MLTKQTALVAKCEVFSPCSLWVSSMGEEDYGFLEKLAKLEVVREATELEVKSKKSSEARSLHRRGKAADSEAVPS